MEHMQMCFECLNMYFEGDPPHDQFFCRALMCQGQLMSLWNWWQEYCMNNSVFCLFFCIWFVSYSTHFLVFNTSVLYFQGVRPLLQPGLCHHLVPSLKQVVKSLEEVDDQDHSWRAELMIQLIKCILDSGELEDAAHYAKVTEKFIKSHTPYLYPGFYTLQVSRLLKVEWLSCFVGCFLLLPLLGQQMKIVCCANSDMLINMHCMTLMLTLPNDGNAVLSLPEEKSSIAGVLPQARLKEIEKLDQWLEAAVKEGRPKAVQALCASQWHLCLPLLQHNLRKCIKMPLVKLALVLEYTQSMSLEMRCEVHSELAAIEEEEGDLKATLSHLEKALLLDSGTYRERLSSALHLLQLRRTPYQTPACPLDKAAKIITDRRPLLVSVGLLLAPFDFQTALDLFNIKKLIIYKSFLFSHYFRVKLWVTLAKTARKLEVWDVCRAACRFCLLYDGGAGKSAETNSELMKLLPINMSPLMSCFESRETNLFSLTQATVQQLLEEGVHLNSPAVLPQGEKVQVAEDDQRWILYRDWIQSLSSYATRCFLRGGEIGVEIGERCLVENAAIYLWNYNTHMLAAEEYKLLLPTFQNLVDMLLRLKDIRYNLTMCVMVCNAVTRGLMIQPVCDSVRSSAKGRHSGSKHGTPEAAGLKDVKKALEVGLCEYALRISSGDTTGETVPIAVRKLVLTSWVQIKQLLHQQIGVKLDIFKDKEVAAMSRVLVGVEMLNCNRHPKLMDFSVPSLSTLAGMASECSWLDAVVELQVWCQLAAFCHSAEDHSLVLLCTEKALQLEKAAEDMILSGVRYSLIRLFFFSSSLFHSFAEKTGSQELCVTAAGHFWNACLPLTQSPRDKWWLKEHLEKILNILLHIRKSASVSHLRCTLAHSLSQKFAYIRLGS
uniref:Cilia and flagella associated protein 46 n=1 Tax=Poecilia latipinna TaxID=48699 RepID=A0A3B3VSN3_9TELE